MTDHAVSNALNAFGSKLNVHQWVELRKIMYQVKALENAVARVREMDPMYFDDICGTSCRFCDESGTHTADCLWKQVQ